MLKKKIFIIYFDTLNNFLFYFRPTFRSYKPQDENLKKSVLDEAKPGNVQTLVQDQLSLASNTAVDEELVRKIKNKIFNRLFLKFKVKTINEMCIFVPEYK